MRDWYIVSALLRKNPAVAVAIVVLVSVVLSGVFAPVLAPYGADDQDLSKRLTPPVWAEGGSRQYILGTDGLGRDILSRMIYGARISLIVGLAAVLIQGTIGVGLGLVAGYSGRWVDAVIMRVADIQLAIPFMVLAIAVMAVLGGGLRNVVLVLGITGWVSYGRVVRSEVLSIREMDFVESARATGASDLRIILKHILPNVVTSVLVISTLQVARMIIAEAALSYLGLGVQPPNPTWGGMVADGRNWITRAWWISTLPGAAIFVTVLSINILGDSIIDHLDPTLRRSS